MMNLNDDKTLASTLAKRGMNQKRELTDYELQLQLNIVDLAINSIKKEDSFVWYDMCCGYFKAKQDVLKRIPDHSNYPILVSYAGG